jgi:hypothetical protein
MRIFMFIFMTGIVFPANIKNTVYKEEYNVVEGQLAYVQMCNDDFYASLLLGLFSPYRF